jgi:hypothetical protein
VIVPDNNDGEVVDDDDDSETLAPLLLDTDVNKFLIKSAFDSTLSTSLMFTVLILLFDDDAIDDVEIVAFFTFFVVVVVIIVGVVLVSLFSHNGRNRSVFLVLVLMLSHFDDNLSVDDFLHLSASPSFLAL